jgi:hypothetical protein
MLPLLNRALGDVSDIPDSIRTDLKRAADDNVWRALRMTGELLRIMRRLRDAGITPVPWKGPILGQQAYGSPGLRMFYDLDILIRREDMDRAIDILRDDGLFPAHPMKLREQKTYIDHQGSFELQRRDDGGWVELHWAVVPTYYAPPRVVEELWERLAPVPLGRGTVDGLGPEDNFEGLCVHGSKHQFERMLWIADIAMLTKANPDLDWGALLARARRNGTLRMVKLGVLLAASLANAAIPRWVLRAAQSDQSARTLSAQVHATLFHGHSSNLGEFVFHARMRERARDRSRYVLGILFTPSRSDWEAVTMPRVLFPLYSAVRPFRLAVKFGTRAAAAATRR